MVKLVVYLILFLNLKLLKKHSFRRHLNTLYGTKYSRMDQVKFMEDININQKLFPMKSYGLKIIPEILKIIYSKFKDQGIYNRLRILKFYLKKLGHVYMDSFSHFSFIFSFLLYVFSLYWYYFPDTLYAHITYTYSCFTLYLKLDYATLDYVTYYRDAC